MGMVKVMKRDVLAGKVMSRILDQRGAAWVSDLGNAVEAAFIKGLCLGGAEG